MRVLLFGVGSQGDVRPLVALAGRLAERGHHVDLVAPPLFRPLAIAARVPFTPVPLDMLGVAGPLTDARGVPRYRRLTGILGGESLPVLRSLWAVAEAARPDVVVHHPLLPLGQHVAERLGVPAVLACPQPSVVPTGAFRSPVWGAAAPARLPAAVNRLSHRAARLRAGRAARVPVDAWRAEAGLPDRARRHDPLYRPDGSLVPALHGVSPLVLPRPADWPDAAELTGYWFLPTPPAWRPPRALARFLDEGEPPVYLGFGSMPVDEPGRLGRTVDAVARALDTRVVVASGYQGLRAAESSSRVLVLRHAPHDWLLPRMSAVVHHGGAGTTGAAAAAGRPQVICPAGFDQPFWADRMVALGVARRGAGLHELTAPRLREVLGAALEDPGLRCRADELGRAVRAEDGTGTAVSALERMVSNPTGAMVASR